ncbi:MAG TPA: hypothetical protein VMW72_07255 [Sedimentisphaerales bacterium]|nr:hypothetical protein [Sedimentisphaerales bacterium]
MNVNSLITKDYRKNDVFVVRINKPNFRNGQNERKLTYNKGLQKIRCFRSPKNKPNQSQFPKGRNELRAYPNNRGVMRPSEKSEAKAAGQKGSEAWFSPRRERFWPITQASGFAAGRNRAGYLDRLLTSLAGKSGLSLILLLTIFNMPGKRQRFGFPHLYLRLPVQESTGAGKSGSL